jgi:hypothetical protein
VGRCTADSGFDEDMHSRHRATWDNCSTPSAARASCRWRCI